MRQNHLLQRTLRIGDGMEVVLSVSLFETPEEARRVSNELQHGMSGMLDCHLVRITGNGTADDSGLTLRQFLVDMGLMGFKHSVKPVDIQGTAIVVPSVRLG